MRRLQTARLGAQRGMTLIDALVAMGLITMGGAGFLGIQLVVLRANEAARQLSEGTNLARAQMEQLLYATSPPASGSERVDGYGCVAGGACTQRGTIYTRSFTVGSGTLAAVQVRVAWADGGGVSHSVVLDGRR